jgi:hypothetical protein
LLLPYLAEHPPTHILVARFVGFKPGAKRPPSGSTRRPPRDLDHLRAALGHGADVHAGLGGAAILDFGRLKAARQFRSQTAK